MDGWIRSFVVVTYSSSISATKQGSDHSSRGLLPPCVMVQDVQQDKRMDNHICDGILAVLQQESGRRW